MDDSEKVANEYPAEPGLGRSRLRALMATRLPISWSMETIAVEVRRLNQDEIIESGHRGP